MIRARAVPAWTVLAVAAAALASQSVLELRVAAGQKAQGEIAFDGEEDRVAVDLLAGSKLTFTAKTSKKSPLRPTGDLYDATGALVAVDASQRVTKPTSVTIKNWLVPATGTYLLGVRGTSAGPTGLYDLTTAAKPAPKAKPVAATIGAANETDEIGFDALAGTIATIALKDAKGSKLIPRIRAVLGPDAAPLALDGVKRKSTDRSDTLTGLALPAFGRYVVRVQDNAGEVGGYTLAVTLKAPKIQKTKADLRGASGGESSAGAISSIEILPGSVALEPARTLQLVAKATYADGRVRDATRAVAWSSRDVRVASVENGARCGLITAKADGITTLQAWAGAVEAREVLASVHGVAVQTISVVPAAPVVAPGDTIVLCAVAANASGVDVSNAVVWDVVPGGVPVTIAGSRVTAGGTAGTVQLTASVGGQTSAPVTLTVTARRVERIVVAPAYSEIAGGSRALTATATYSDGSTGDVTATATWASDNLAAATTSGATASFVAAGTAGIRATLDGVSSRSAVLNCGPVALQTVAVHGAATVPHGATRAFTADGSFADGGTRDVTEAAAWTSSAAGAVSVDTTAGVRGRATSNADSGAATITASILTGAGAKSGQSATAAAVAERTSLVVVPRITSVAVTTILPLRAYFAKSDGAFEDVTALATWSTSAPAAATVAGGVVTGVADGGAVIAASLDGRTANAVVLCGASRVSSVVVAPLTATPLGDAAQAAASATFFANGADGPAVAVGSAASWFTSDPLALPIGAAGTVSPRRIATSNVNAVLAGIASAAAAAAGTAAAERSLGVFPQLARSPAGGNVQLAAQVTASDGSVTDRAATSSWNSATTAKATVTPGGLVHAVAKGTSVISASRAAPGVADAQTFAVLSDPPTISSVTPAVLARGSTGAVVTINGTDLDGTSAAVSISGGGITAAAAPAVNGTGTQATISVDVTAGAPLTARDVTYTTLSGSATRTGAITIISTTPTITGVSPLNIDVPASGSTQTTLTVTGTNFGAGDGFLLAPHAGVTVSNQVVVNATTMTGTVTVQSSAQKARLDVTVVQSAQSGGQMATLTGGLKIGPPDPTVSAISPAFFRPGDQNASGSITGTNFNSGISVSFSGASGIFAYTATRQSATLLTFQLTATPNASPGLYDLVLQNTGDISRTFTGLLVLAPRDPVVSSFSAASLSRGVSGVSVDVRGTGFRSGDSLSASGSGVTFSGVTVVSAEQITATAGVASNATISLRDLVVTHPANVGGRSGTLTGAFRVTDSVPTVTSLNPSTIGRTGSGGPTRRVPVTITGTNFCTGASVTLTRASSSGLTVVSNSAVVLSDTSLAFDVDVAGSATVGTWDVKVTNPSSIGDSGTTGANKLSLVSETTLVVNRVAAKTGPAQGGGQVTVYGAGFVRGCQVAFGAQTAPGAQFIDQNTLVCTVPAPANPANATSTTGSTTATTFVDVKVTIYPGLQNTAFATLTSGYGYLANTTVFKILQSFPADSSTGVPQNLRSAVVRLSDFANTATPHAGTSLATSANPSLTDCGWFESGASFVTGQTVGFGADRRFLVFSRTSTGNLSAINPVTPGRYVLQTSTSVKSAAGAALVPAKLAQALTYDQWIFTISTSVADNTAPTLSSAAPTANATGVSTNTRVALTFSEDMDPQTITTSSVTLTQGATSIACDVSLSNDCRTVTLTPFTELATSTQYMITITGTVADLCANSFSSTTQTFTTGSGTDSTSPTIDSVVFEEIPADMDGSGTWTSGTDTPASTSSTSAAFDLYLPKSGWKVVATFSDTGGSGVDETQFSAKASVAVGSASANAELASKFTVTSNRAEWTVPSADAFAAGEDVTLTFLVKDKAGNTSSSKVVTFDTVDINATALGAGGGDLTPFNSRETWVLRFDRDVYTATLSTTGTAPTATQQCTTTAAANGIVDIEEAMRISGLATANMTTDAANTVNGPSVGTNAIALRLFEERLRATLRARYGVGEDGSRGADAADIEFLLPGEQGSLSSLPTWSSSANGSSTNAYSEMDIGGDTGPNSSQTGAYTVIGYSFVDPRNRNREADMNDGNSAGNNNGIFGINIAKSVMNLSTSGSTWGARVLKNFQTAKGGTPIGEGSLDDDVLAGTYDRTSSSASNTQAMKDRYDRIMDAIESAAMSVSSITAHEIGHALGLVPDGGPKTGFFGNAPRANTFTEATASFPNTSGHLNAIGNDIMSPASTTDQRTATGTDFMRFSAYDRDYLLQRQVHDEGR